jgi:hypothetical protein
MLQAHSLLWNYLWIAPNILLLGLGLLLWRRGSGDRFPAFVAFAIVSALGGMAAFVADVVPSVTAENFWHVAWANLLIESLLKFVVIGEAFSGVLLPYPSIGRLGRLVATGLGAVLVLIAALVAALSRGDSPMQLISGFHILEQTVFMIELGLLIIIFLFAAYFKLAWNRVSFGVLLGFGVSACVYLASWAIMTNATPSPQGRAALDVVNMATYHLSVLIWIYYLLVPHKVRKTVVRLPENNLEVWNRELERLLQ